MMIWSTKSQRKVNILIVHQNLQNFMADSNLVNMSCFGQQNVNTSQGGHSTSNFTEFHDGCEFSQHFMIWSTESQLMST